MTENKIVVVCSSCKREYSVSQAHLGKKAKCKCGELIEINSASREEKKKANTKEQEKVEKKKSRLATVVGCCVTILLAWYFLLVVPRLIIGFFSPKEVTVKHTVQNEDDLAVVSVGSIADQFKFFGKQLYFCGVDMTNYGFILNNLSKKHKEVQLEPGWHVLTFVYGPRNISVKTERSDFLLKNISINAEAKHSYEVEYQLEGDDLILNIVDNT